MAAASSSGRKPKQQRPPPSVIVISDHDHLQALPASVPLTDELVQWPKPLESRALLTSLSDAAQPQLEVTNQNAVQHPCHEHPLSAFRIIGNEYTCACDLCGALCSATEQPDFVAKLTIDIRHAKDMLTAFQVIWLCSDEKCRKRDAEAMPRFTICSRCMWSASHRLCCALPVKGTRWG